MLERDIERKVCEYARFRELLVYKFTSPARAAVPDRVFVMPSGKVFFIEFKRPGAKPTPSQQREHDRLMKYNVPVFVIDDVTMGKVVIDGMMINERSYT